MPFSIFFIPFISKQVSELNVELNNYINIFETIQNRENHRCIQILIPHFVEFISETWWLFFISSYIIKYYCAKKNCIDLNW